MIMTAKQILQQRLHNQQIAGTKSKKPEDIVRWLGAVQAQDYAGAKWSVGLRLPGSTDAIIEQTITDGKIIRTWTQRGTLHFMAADDVRWMLDLSGPRVHKSLDTQIKRTGLDAAVLKKCDKIISKALEGGKQLTRNEIKELLEAKKIPTQDNGLNYILVHASLMQLICHGPRKGKEFTFVLMDDWVPAHKKIKNDEAIVKLAERYFTGHGPATAEDFAWWTGGTKKDVQFAIDALGKKLQQETVNGNTYYSINSESSAKNDIHLLPGFDEYMLGYKDRSLALADEHNKKVTGAANGLFAATVVVNGAIAATWKRTVKKDSVAIEITPFEKLSAANKKGIEKEAQRFAAFLQQPYDLSFL
jgi:hypothetical protein